MDGERIARFWALERVGERESTIACDLFTTSAGLEVRCHKGTTVLRAQRVASRTDAMNLCAAWKAAYRAEGWNEPAE